MPTDFYDRYGQPVAYIEDEEHRYLLMANRSDIFTMFQFLLIQEVI